MIRWRMTIPRIFIVGNEEGCVYAPTPLTIYAREWDFRDNTYSDSFPVLIPDQYQNVSFHIGERILLNTNGDTRIFAGKDYRQHVTETAPQTPEGKGARLLAQWRKGRGDQ